ncbi:MAG TPA: hypothetical protein VGH97_12210 [Thermoanaerobaculia bacterium]
MIRRTIAVGALLWAVLASGARAQGNVGLSGNVGVGASIGLVDDISADFSSGSFKHSDVNGWVDYRFEKSSLLRLTFGSMRIAQTHSQSTVETPDGPVEVPLIKERVGYVTVGASYLFWEGWFSSGIFGGIGGYRVTPDEVPPPYTAFADQKQTVFGWHFGTEAIFRVYKSSGIVLRLTYHNVSATPHRQFLNANTGAVVRF